MWNENLDHEDAKGHEEHEARRAERSARHLARPSRFVTFASLRAFVVQTPFPRPRGAIFRADAHGVGAATAHENVIPSTGSGRWLSELAPNTTLQRESSEASFTSFRTGSPPGIGDSSLEVRRSAFWPVDPLRVTAEGIFRAVLSLLFALWFVLRLAAPAAAGGIVLTAGPPGDAGLQVDVALLSPAPPRAQELPPAPRTYVVQAGDTLSGIAARFNVDSLDLAARNRLTNPDRLLVGQTLRIDAPMTARPSLPANGSLARVQLWPWPPAQGQTLVLWLRSRAPLTITATFAGEPWPVTAEGLHGWAVVPISVLAAPGPTPLEIQAGQATFTLPVPVQAGVFGRETIPDEISAPILSQADKVRAELERLTVLFAGISSLPWTPRVRFRSPLKGDYPHSSPFGSRRTYGESSGINAHLGEDYSAPAGTPVLAPAGGVVVLAEPLFVRGNAVVVDHGRGVFTGYWHLEQLSVKAGDTVTAGQQLGTVGSTGLSTGAHLHWELRINGVAVDPLQWVEKRTSNE
jgi:murein DD-endopeptidase MepM/ murein hydrolase activator NlpD